MESILSVLLFVGFFYLMMRFACGAHMRTGGGCGHSSHRHNQSGENKRDQAISAAKQRTRDPVCGIEIEPARASVSTQYGADTFYFCSKDCYRKFKERPEYFTEIVRTEKRYVA
jgi:YHS domain-containing protein